MGQHGFDVYRINQAKKHKHTPPPPPPPPPPPEIIIEYLPAPVPPVALLSPAPAPPPAPAPCPARALPYTNYQSLYENIKQQNTSLEYKLRTSADDSSLWSQLNQFNDQQKQYFAACNGWLFWIYIFLEIIVLIILFLVNQTWSLLSKCVFGSVFLIYPFVIFDLECWIYSAVPWIKKQLFFE